MSNSLRPHGLQHARLPLFFTISWSLLKLMSIESVMPSNHLTSITAFFSCPQSFLAPPRRHFPGGAVIKNPSANAGDTRDMGSITVFGRSPGGGNDNLLQYSCLGNPMDCNMPGFPVLHCLLELAQTDIHRVCDAIQPSHLCRPLLLLPSILPSIRVFSHELALCIKWPKIYIHTHTHTHINWITLLYTRN